MGNICTRTYSHDVGNLELGLHSMHSRLDVSSEGQDVQVLLYQ